MKKREGEGAGTGTAVFECVVSDLEGGGQGTHRLAADVGHGDGMAATFYGCAVPGMCYGGSERRVCIIRVLQYNLLCIYQVVAFR